MGGNKIVQPAQAADAASRPPDGGAHSAHFTAPGVERAATTDVFASWKPQELKHRPDFTQQSHEQAQLRKPVEGHAPTFPEGEDAETNSVNQRHAKEFDDNRLQASDDGIIKAVPWRDGYFYFDLAKDTWKAAEKGAYYCRYCSMQLTASSVVAHVQSGRHRHARLAPPSIGGSTASPECPSSALRPPPLPNDGTGGSAGAAYDGPALACWQEWDALNNIVRCKACNKICDGVHEGSKDHQRRVEVFLWHLQAPPIAYKAPLQPWLAWVPDETFGTGKYLRCLLCRKWVSDCEEFDTSAYEGSHGNPSGLNQKDHSKRLANLDMYMFDLAEEKAVFHPETAACAAGSYARSTEGVRSAGTGGLKAPSGSSSSPPVPTLPKGWRAAWNDDYQQYYYYANGREPQWDVPTEEVRPVVDLVS